MAFSRPRYTRQRSGPSASSVIALLLLVGSTFAALTMGGPPAPVPATAPAAEFSAERAMALVADIAQRPHPIGSADHTRVRDYLIATLQSLKLNVERQKTTVVRLEAGGARAATVENLLVRIKGSNSTGAILVASHYDSVPASPGAADDGAGLAAMLEALRALTAVPQLQNDIIILFTDAEELGLLGAEAFVRDHPWAKDVAVAVNLEARGTNGPSMMFETGENNGAVVREWAAVVPRATGSSLTYEIYKRLPNDTDFSVFRRLGIVGLNFAYIGNWRAYHTPSDSAAALDPGSLQHHGVAALALMRRFGAMDLASLKERDAVYFALPVIRTVVRYSTVWVRPLAVLAVIAFVWVVVSALRRLNTSEGGLLLALVMWALMVGLAGLWAFYFSRAVGWVHARWLSPGDLLMSGPYALALVMTIVGAGVFAYAMLRRVFAAQTLALSGLLLCLVVTSVASWTVIPGGSYVFLWPLLASLIAVTLLPSAIDAHAAISTTRTVVICALGLPSTLILWPLALMLFQSLGLTPESGAGLGVLTMFSLFALAPQGELVADKTRVWPACAALLAAVVCFGYGMATTRYSDAQPRSVNVVYAVDADKREAYWVSRTPEVNPWLRQFLGDKPASGRPAVLLPASAPEGTPGYFHQRTDLADVKLPAAVAVPGGEAAEQGRSLSVRVTPSAEGHALSIWLSGAAVLEARINGRDVGMGAAGIQPSDDRWTLEYGNAPASGVTIALMLKNRDRITVAVLDRSAGWPTLAGKMFTPRPGDLMPIHSGDQTVIRRNFVF